MSDREAYQLGYAHAMECLMETNPFDFDFESGNHAAYAHGYTDGRMDYYVDMDVI
jgi:hypothetical protein